MVTKCIKSGDPYWWSYYFDSTTSNYGSIPCPLVAILFQEFIEISIHIIVDDSIVSILMDCVIYNYHQVSIINRNIHFILYDSCIRFPSVTTPLPCIFLGEPHPSPVRSSRRGSRARRPPGLPRLQIQRLSGTNQSWEELSRRGSQRWGLAMGKMLYDPYGDY